MHRPVHKPESGFAPKGVVFTEPEKRVVKAEPSSSAPSTGTGKSADDAVQAEGQGDGWKTVSKKKKSAAKSPAKVDAKQGKASS